MLADGACGPVVGVMRGGALGDFVLTLPAIAALRAAHPDCRLALLAHARYAALAGPDLVVDLDGAAVAGLYAAPPAEGGAARTGTAALDAGLRRLLGRTRVLLAYSTDSSGRLADNLSCWAAGQIHLADPRPAAAQSA